MRFATKAIHAGQEPDPRTGAVTPPIYATSTYSRKGQDAYAYARSANPTRDALQQSLAALESGKHALAFSSGMGAITTALTLLKKGDHVLVTDDCYGGVYRIFTTIMSQYGIDSTFLDLRDLVDVEDAFRPETRILWMESPTNPLMKVVDLKELAFIAKAHEALSVCDSTFASPALQNPLAVPSAFDCWLALRGIKTLPVRMERHCDNAEMLSKFLKDHKAVAKVHYPGLPGDPGHGIAKKQMRRFGGMLSFELRDSTRLVERLKRLEVILLAESLGGVESLIEHPASMTHTSVPKEQREKQGITDGLVRFSVGLEDAQDLTEDLGRALG